MERHQDTTLSSSPTGAGLPYDQNRTIDHSDRHIAGSARPHSTAGLRQMTLFRSFLSTLNRHFGRYVAINGSGAARNTTLSKDNA